MVNFVPGEYIKKDVLSVSDTGGSPPNGSRLCDLLVTSPYALPLSYRPFCTSLCRGARKRYGKFIQHLESCLI